MNANTTNFPLLHGPPGLSSCLQDLWIGVLNGTHTNLQGIVNNQGKQVSDIAQAVGVTYQLCKNTCGSGSEPFDWIGFSKLFSSWFLPCLALISQLPYGANDKLDNFESMVLTVGSPMLAAYSLALSVTSNRWMVKQFRRSHRHQGYLAAKIMASLQQVSFCLPGEEYVLPSLIMLQSNEVWWRKLNDGLNYARSQWTLPAIMSMVYVALAYLLTWVDTITIENQGSGNCQWQSASTLWISLLAIVVCYLQLSPKSDLNRINRALEYANQRFDVATETSQVERCTGTRTIIVESDCRDRVRDDELCTTPICFYARVFSWLQEARKMAEAFDAASQNASNNITLPSSRSSRIVQFSTLRHDHAGIDYLDIFAISVIAALFLHWGVTGPAIVVIYLTPTKGLDCLSGSLFLYGLLATIVWMLCILSSTLTRSYSASRQGLRRKVTGWLAVTTRLVAKILAGLNALWMVLLSLLQFGNVYNSCYCRSGFPGFWNKTFIQLQFSKDDHGASVLYSVVGMITLSSVSLLFIIAINLLKRSPEPPTSSLEHAYEEYIQMVDLS